MQIDKGDADALRSVLCPSVGNRGKCVGSQRVVGALVDRPGEWGGLRVIDLSDPAAPRQVGVYRTPRSRRFPPIDLGVYSAHRAVAGEGLAYVAWNSDGLRVLDLTGKAPREVGFFVPPNHPDPVGALPAKAYVVGVARAAGFVVITDINSGLYVLDAPGGERAPRRRR